MGTSEKSNFTSAISFSLITSPSGFAKITISFTISGSVDRFIERIIISSSLVLTLPPERSMLLILITLEIKLKLSPYFSKSFSLISTAIITGG